MKTTLTLEKNDDYGHRFCFSRRGSLTRSREQTTIKGMRRVIGRVNAFDVLFVELLLIAALCTPITYAIWRQLAAGEIPFIREGLSAFGAIFVLVAVIDAACVTMATRRLARWVNRHR